jgi:tetratricopeptide (TPR) repeat protein
MSKKRSVWTRAWSSGLLLLLSLLSVIGVTVAAPGQNGGIHESSQERAYNEYVVNARKLILSSKYEPAEKLLDSAIHLNPQAYQGYRWRAFIFEQTGKCKEAIADANSAISRDPGHKSGISTKFNCLVKMGQYKEAIALTNVFAKQFPHAAWIYLVRGRSLCATGKHAQAIPDLSIILEDYPNSFGARTPRALAYAGVGNYEAALKDIESILKLARQSLRLTVTPSKMDSNDKGFYTTISNNFDHQLQHTGKTAKSLFACALCDFVLGKYPQTVQACTEIIKLNGKIIQPWILRAYANLSLKQVEAARADIEKAISLAPDSDDGYTALANLNFLNGSYVQSIDELSQKLKVSPHSVAILVARGRVFADLNKQPEALADFTRALELNSKQPEVFTARAETYQAMQNWNAAISDFSKAISLEPRCPIEACKGRAACYCEQHLYQKAIDDLDKLTVCSHSAKPFFARSICYEKLGERERAAADKRTAEEFVSMDAISAPSYGF